MPSIFGHVIAASFFTSIFQLVNRRKNLLFWAGFCAFFPDLDVIGFQFGIPYQSQWGHRGFTHSLFFCTIFGLFIAWCIGRTSPDFKKIAALLVLSTVSHPLLDMLTNGGRGCAFWWPLSPARIFFPFRPIQVSPIGIADFFSTWGMRVLLSELLWIGLPCWLVWIGVKGIRLLYSDSRG